jgi:hypothetical protein
VLYKSNTVGIIRVTQQVFYKSNTAGVL